MLNKCWLIKIKVNFYRGIVYKINKSKIDFILLIVNFYKKLFNVKIKEIESKIR